MQVYFALSVLIFVNSLTVNMASEDSTSAPVVGSFFVPRRQLFRAVTVSGALLSSIVASRDHLGTSTKWTVHLFLFACFYGCTVWVTFVAGIVMFKNLPRHTFGNLQSKLFPRYFQFCGAAVGSCLLLEVARRTNDDDASASMPIAQTRCLSAVLATIAANHFVLEPKTTSLMFRRHAVERRIGTGKEVGVLRPDPSLLVGKEEDAKLLETLSKQFGKLHGMSASLNLVALCLATWHLVWLGSRLDFDST